MNKRFKQSFSEIGKQFFYILSYQSYHLSFGKSLKFNIYQTNNDCHLTLKLTEVDPIHFLANRFSFERNIKKSLSKRQDIFKILIKEIKRRYEN